MHVKGKQKVVPGGEKKQPIAFSGPIPAWSTNRNLFSPINGREISSSVYRQTRLGQLYINLLMEEETTENTATEENGDAENN